MRGRSRPVLLLLAAALLVASGPGCDRNARHDVLTFFFTGVPPLDEGGKAPEKAKAPERKAPEESAKKKRVVVKATRYSHGPYASGACYLCHETSETGGYRGLGKKEEAKGAIAKAGIVPGKLVAPLRELCVRCHAAKSPEKARGEGLWVHGPVAAGYCTACHGPHAGPQPHLLVKNANDACRDCHGEGFLVGKALHEGKTECLACHNAHFGRDGRLLTSEHREAW